MKKLLIISPYFPPVNSADMQRVRMTLPYLKDLGWDAEVVCVDPEYVDINKDELLTEGLPPGLKIHRVKALPKKLTARFGLGSIAIRSLWFFRKRVNSMLRSKKFDLIYFSTTQFPVCVLGPYWKRKFDIPYVIDMQDPWHSEYYQDKSKAQRPKKYWFSYRLNKYLEPGAIKNVDGLISVSQNYIDVLRQKYPAISAKPAAVITFGAFEPDLAIAAANSRAFRPLLNPGYKNVVYVGRGGDDMAEALTPVFNALKDAVHSTPAWYGKIKLYFIGTSYAPAGKGKPTILPLAKKLGVDGLVVEMTDRINYYHALLTLQEADALFVPGSDDPQYTASKIYPYLLVKKPLFAVFNKHSSAIKILQDYGVKRVYNYEDIPAKAVLDFLTALIHDELGADEYDPSVVAKHSAAGMAAAQCRLFDQLVR